MLKIDNEFKNAVPFKLTKEQYEGLERLLIAQGCLDTIKTWNGFIIDGHNRYEICTQHDICFNTKEVDLPDREAVLDWIPAYQLGRRNMDKMQESYLRGLQYEREKKKIGEHQGNQHTDWKGEGVAPFQKTAEKLAEQHKVSERTIYTDSQFVKALDTISTNVGEEIKDKVLTKEINTTKEDIMKIAQFPIEKQKELFSDISKPIRVKKKKPVITKFVKLEVKAKVEPVDFSFLADEPQETEEDKEFNRLLDETIAGAELMEQLKYAVCIPIVSEFLIKSLKEKLSQYPDTLGNEDNEDRKAFVNIFNILKRIIRKENI